MDRIRLKIVGQSGAGLLSTGELVVRALKEMGYHIVADREYPSLIKGGHSCFIINASMEEIRGFSSETDVMVAIDRPSLFAYFDQLKKGGILVHGYDRVQGIEPILKKARARKVKVIGVATRALAEAQGGNYLMVNVVLAGMIWKVFGFDYKYIKKSVEVEFADKPKLLAIDLKCVKAGFDAAETVKELPEPSAANKKRVRKMKLVDGNQAVALGAIHAGVRTYFAYPMSPSSSILTNLAKWSGKTGMIVKQCEDEITVANMALGAMYMGSRALCATSGGGYDLMTETVSLAGITETPLVVVLCQRPGPGTGLPTWTCQSDLNLAIYSSHGEFPKVVIALSHPEDAFDLTQHALNIAEKYQCVVILLSEKVICEAKWSVDAFKQKKISIQRGIISGAALEKLESRDRYKISKSGLSKRWLPGSSDAYYFANGDEHWEDGELTEDAIPAREMYAKRMRKLKTIQEILPEPEIFGVKKDADISFVGWGSTKNVIHDVIETAKKRGVKVNYLHYSYVWPLKVELARKFCQENANLHIIDGNYTGQFAQLFEAEVKHFAKGYLRKWDGRPFYIEELETYIKQHGK
ncbi:2-oxoacid:acceptor oxidoreductase subunit alpha [Candidatus Peregrinibacteria bacterium]|nr:2-oxoacid:acceptor oxidoreductase subunit alpha [Candidatus Peregrinibacteria bacterium]